MFSECLVDPQTRFTVMTPRAVTLTLQICTFCWHFPWTSSHWTRIFSTHSTLWVSEWYGTEHSQNSHLSQCEMETWQKIQHREQIPAMPAPTNQKSHFNKQLFMLKSSKLFTIASNSFATIQAAKITAGCAWEQEKADTEGRHTAGFRNISNISKLTFYFPKIDSNQASSC